MTQIRFMQVPPNKRIHDIAEKLMQKHNLAEFVVTALETHAAEYRVSLVNLNLCNEQQIDLMVNKKMDEALDHIISAFPQTIVTAFHVTQAKKAEEQKDTRSHKS
jgi:hypothetical protein